MAEGFLGRWAQRKADARRGLPLVEPAVLAAAPTPQPVAATPAPAAVAAPAPVTESDLLSDAASDGLASTVTPWVAAAHHRGVPMRVDEMNAITCGGTQGISNTYGSALWALDTMFAMAVAPTPVPATET